MKLERIRPYEDCNGRVGRLIMLKECLKHVGGKAVCVHLIKTDEGLILLDSGYPNAAHLVVDSIWRFGFDPKDVKWHLGGPWHSRGQRFDPAYLHQKDLKS